MAEQTQTTGAPQEGEQKSDALTCRARYERLKTERDPYLRRARECAALTLPSLMPPEGHNGSTELPTPFQSAGAEGVNSLAAKLLLAMLPPGSSFFRLELDDTEKDRIRQLANSGTDILGEIDTSLGKIEKAVLKAIEQRAWRPSTFDGMKHLLVCGNVLVQILDSGAMRMHYLDRYVVKRDGEGNVLDVIAHESIAKTALEPAARQLVDESDDKEAQEKESVDVYTRIYRDKDVYRVYQEVCGQVVPGSQGQYPLDKTPWVPLRYCKIDGQDYGRGRVEEYLGDFQSLESLSQSIVEGTAIMTKTVFLLNEAGITDAKKLAEAANGEVMEGNVNDVGVLRVDKFGDYQVALKKADDLEKRLKSAFLVAQQRQAERVTAEEVREVVEELETTLGGVYSILAEEFQLPILKRLLHQLGKKRKISRLPESVTPTIITGLAALGRTADYQKLRAFMQEIVTTLGEQALEYLNVGTVLQRTLGAFQIEEKGLLRSEQDVQAERQKKMQAELVGKLGPNAIKAEADMAQAAQQQSTAQQ